MEKSAVLRCIYITEHLLLFKNRVADCCRTVGFSFGRIHLLLIPSFHLNSQCSDWKNIFHSYGNQHFPCPLPSEHPKGHPLRQN